MSYDCDFSICFSALSILHYLTNSDHTVQSKISELYCKSVHSIGDEWQLVISFNSAMIITLFVLQIPILGESK